MDAEKYHCGCGKVEWQVQDHIQDKVKEQDEEHVEEVKRIYGIASQIL